MLFETLVNKYSRLNVAIISFLVANTHIVCWILRTTSAIFKVNNVRMQLGVKLLTCIVCINIYIYMGCQDQILR